MTTVLAVLCTPIYLIGWLIGFVSRPFIVGFSQGFNYMFNAEAQRVMTEAQQKIENDE